MSDVQYNAGNIFFGQKPSLYNVNLAQAFFVHAAHPFIGKEVPFAHYQLSRTYFIQGDLLKALNEAESELEAYPENSRTYYILGLTYGYMDREQEAIDAFTKFIEANPTTWAGRNDKAWLQFRVGDIAGALETIDPISGLFNPWVQNTYGTILLNLGRIEEAKSAFLLAKELAESMTEEDWGSSYPGNDPRIYGTGLSAMLRSIDSNLKIIEDKQAAYPQNISELAI